MDPAQNERYQRARQRVQELRGFYTNLAAYVIVNLGLFILDMLTGGGTWFFWPLLGWGIGLAAHAYRVFGPGRRLGADWEERKIRELMAKDDY